MDSEKREVWMVSAVIEATEAQAQEALDAIGKALCPDDDHAGYCPVPWTTMRCRFDDLDPDEKAEWEAEFEQDRARARDAGESDT